MIGAILNAWKPIWNDLPADERARLKARQGVAYELQEDCVVLNPSTHQLVPTDGETMGEIAMRGNIVMKGYLKSPEATAKSFAGGWFWTGDLGVVHTDGYIEIRDRSKDIIISGGESPCAFVELVSDRKATENDLLDHCRQRLAGFKRREYSTG